MRLIDADALENEINSWGCNDYDKYDFIEAIDNAPTVEERPQGEWIKLRDYDFKCSLCGESMMDKYNFCPECGARMKGGAE